uniref:Uncharacterized protein n=1 Tax=Desertifilum tharense IPPAS B-1220 TaxID=1781255 RepID=A0ACD5GRH5_9CYAN
MGEEKIGRLDDYQLSTLFSLGTPLLGVQATELRTNSALSSDSEHRCLVCKLRNSEPTQHSLLTRNSELGTLHSFPHSALSTLHSALGEALREAL